MKYDAILYVTPDSINEADSRISGGKILAQPRSFTMYNVDDPMLYTSFNFASAVTNSLNNMGHGYSCKVTDFKKWVVVDVSHHNSITGKTSSKVFLIVFKEKGEGIVLSTHNRFRSISGVEQAISYIRNSCGALQSDTQNRIG